MTVHNELKPAEVVEQLDRYIIGQASAKRSVAIALRNRWRRQQVEGELKEEISPKNILLIGPTGVGKTEIARRLAKLANAPFIKVEASKFTEVGYVGRDVESMVRDLVEMAIKLTREEAIKKVDEQATKAAEDKIIAAMQSSHTGKINSVASDDEIRTLLRKGMLNDRLIEIEVEDNNQASFQLFTPSSNRSMDEMESNMNDWFKNIIPKQKKMRTMKVSDALRTLKSEVAEDNIDKEAIEHEAITRAEQMGIIFIDEIDKIAATGNSAGGKGPDVSREGVQRDLLPIIEGSTVKTKYGFIKTDHILFIASGAFHVAKPSDLIPELQGRFPIRVTLDKLTRDDFVRILSEPHNSLIKQYEALLATEGLNVTVTQDAIDAMADAAYRANEQMQNIGARRLHTVIERVFDDISFSACDMKDEKIEIDANYVRSHLDNLIENQDMGKYIL